MLHSAMEIWGEVVGCDGTRLFVEGLDGIARLGDTLHLPGGDEPAEIIAVEARRVVALLGTPGQAVRGGDRALLERRTPPAPSADWLGRAFDADGRVLSGPDPMPGPRPAMLQARAPQGAGRRGLGPRLETGVAALDAALPLCQGQRLGIFAGSGVGKTMLLNHLARTASADVVVIVLTGERGREAGALLRDQLPPAPGGERRVVILETSDAPAVRRRRAAWLGLAVAEHFRDEGAQVLLLFDSVTRVAEAHRDIALAAGELPAVRGYPASMPAMLAALAERAGPGLEAPMPDGRVQGDITAVLTVLVAGSDMEEPVADVLRGILDGHVVLDRAVAERGRLPAIDLARSVSRSAPAAWTADEAALAARLRALLARHAEVLPLLRAGLHAPGNDPTLDAAVAAFPALDRFLSTLEAAPRPGWAFRLLRDALPPGSS
ncbi:MAG: flagellum-specific ATP synthase FliI [Pseudomonadota bacterium]